MQLGDNDPDYPSAEPAHEEELIVRGKSKGLRDYQPHQVLATF